MNISEAMAAIAEEAERQGFFARQTESGMWMIRKGNDTFLVDPKNIDGLLKVLSVLIAAGLDWSQIDD